MQCQNGVSLVGGNVLLGNGLFAGTKTNFIFSGSGAVINAQNVTFSGAALLAAAPATYQANFLTLTNCLLVNVTNLATGLLVSTNGNYNGFFNSPYVSWLSPVAITNRNPPFRSVGGGRCYLATNSPWHNVGTTNLAPALLASLAGKTTYPPLVYSNVTFSVPTSLNPQAGRDYSGSPDLGYHYDPLDYVFGGVAVSANLTFTAGTAVGWYHNVANGYGIYLRGPAQENFAGSATAPCVYARNDMVQEGTYGVWAAESYLGGCIGVGGNSTAATAPTANLAFTHCYGHSFEGNFFRDYGDGTLMVVNANHSEFYSGSAGGCLMYLNFTNCLAVRAGLGAGCDCSPRVTMENCTFFGGSLGASRWSGATWPLVVQNCAFAGADLTGINDPSGGNTNITWVNYNSYLTTDSLSAGQGGHYLRVSGYNWQTNWYGNYYLPPASPLLLAGSTTADKLGFYEFTTQASQVLEGDAVVALGYHYVAVDPGTGLPYETLTNNLADYRVDANGDGLPDWWEQYWFGPNASLTAAMQDGQGHTLLADYQSGADPNVIQFFLEATNDFIRSTAGSFQVNLSSGLPGYYAVVVNQPATTNWLAFAATNLTINPLGATDGVYNVSVGLAGSLASPPVWSSYKITVDRVPPVLVVTNPGLVNASATVGKPYLQLQGYANEPLASLAYDLVNALGSSTGQVMVVTDQVFDTNKFDLSTNYFQAYDVPLTNGNNQLTLHVADRAGNMTTTQFNVTLDYRTVTTPPVVQLLWPQAGMAVSGSPITIRGTISDETGTVMAQVVDGSGNASSVNGLVERNGRFWLENVTVNGTTQVSLLATNAAGMGTELDFTLYPSSVALTIDSTPTGNDLYQAFGPVSGTVSDPGATVMVNGATATVDPEPDGNGVYGWSLDQAPIYGLGTATFDVAAFAVGSGSGSGGGSGGGVAARVAEANASSDPEMPAKVMLASYQYVQYAAYQAVSYYAQTQYDATLQPDINNQWQYGYDGSVDNIFVENGQVNITESWTQAGGSGTRTAGGVTTPLDLSHPPFDTAIIADDWAAPVDFKAIHYFADGVDFQGAAAAVSLAARTTLKLYTGGKSQVSRKNLFQLSVGDADEYQPAPSEAVVEDPWMSASIIDIPRSTLKMLGQSVGADGNLWVTLPENTLQDVTVTAPGKKHYYAGVSPTKYKLAIQAAGRTPDLDPDILVANSAYCVGQDVSFALDGVPAGVIPSGFDWTLPGDFVNACIPAPNSTSSPIYWQDASLFKNAVQTNDWYVDGGLGSPATENVCVSCTLNFANGNPAVKYSCEGLFTMFKPNVSWVGNNGGAIAVDGNWEVGFGLHFGNIYNGLSGLGMTFKKTVINDGGFAENYFPIQIIDSASLEYCGTSGLTAHFNGSGLDGHINYLLKWDENTYFDNPGVLISNGNNHQSDSGTFRTFLMFNPNTPLSIEVPLKLVSWNWSGAADASGGWHLVSPDKNITVNNQDTTIIPTWINVLNFPIGYTSSTNTSCQ